LTTIAPGSEWIVDADRCDPAPLRSPDALGALFELILKELELRPLAPPVWHVFPEPGGVTGFVLLRESHLAIHTFPERGFAAISLYCCRPRPRWRWEEALLETLGAGAVSVREIERGRS
jgi:S-adenosylmethionine decarboxylase